MSHNEFTTQKASPLSLPSYVFNETLKSLKWPEENLSSTIDDEGGFYPVRVGEGFELYRYVVTKKLGWGGHSTVWLARDRKDRKHVALKVLSSYATREVEEGRLKEREILQLITKATPSHRGFAHVLHLLDEFQFESFLGRHICFVTDVLSFSIPNFQQDLGKSFTLKFTVNITRDVLKGLEYLHDECNVVHSDLKPANILLRPIDTDLIVQRDLSGEPALMGNFPKNLSPDVLPFHPFQSQPLTPSWFLSGADIRVMKDYLWVIADFGHWHIGDHVTKGFVQPYALRAPEVLLGLEWGPEIDIWSLGCLMFEFLSGCWLFNPKETKDLYRDVVHLAQMSVITGEEHNQDLLESLRNAEGQHLKVALDRAIAENAGFGSLESRSAALGIEVQHKETAAFLKLMQSFLSLDPSARPRAVEALQDPILGLELI